MVIATITSGLGNQLFQYALAKHISVKNGTPLVLDTRFYRSDYAKESQRGFKLDNFNIHYKPLTKQVEYFLKFTKLFKRQTLHPFFSAKIEDYYHYNPDVLRKLNPHIIIKGYWHSEKYFKDISGIIRDDLKFTNTPSPEFAHFYEELKQAAVPVSIHVRRGDYVSHPEFSKTFGFVGLPYYEHAIQSIKEKYPEARFFIFTDDQNWVKENLKLESSAIYVENTGENADIDDLHLMSLCHHNIIANSSYSWWGAWLNSNPDKTVLAPKNWFKNQPNWNTKDLLPSTWQTI
ncbi:alpha-1,2-fucosyltransferase [Pedobacter faecalis]|uniref:alpha-1,2-fucosyltransferase n=1 Tax=Pedobacter faecalis TaxID=3041495 RepID=UPI00254E7ED4|nr:alpha-1,2-fucosyltransferase [Pedobacter sp. ELA7]